MDPLSITTGCVTLVATITKLTVQINGFVREVRGARSDLDAVSRELHSLTTVLEMLAHDASDTARSAFPPSLAQQVTGIVKNCGGVVGQIEVSLEKHGGESAKLKKGVQWSWGGKSDMEQLRSSLEAHKSALDIALQMVEMSIMRDIKADTQEIRDDTAAIPGIKEDTTQILAEIARLQAKLPENVELQGLEGHGSSGFMLQRYLDNLTTYAETGYDVSDGELEEEAAPGTPRAVAEQEEIEHHLEHLNLSQDNTQELPKNITDGLFEDPNKESSLVYTISKAPGTIIEDASVSVDSSFDSPRSSLSGISESEPYRRFIPTFGSRTPHHQNQQRARKSYPPTSMAVPIAADDAPRQSTESSRRSSFVFNRKNTDQSEATKPTKRFSLIPASLKLKNYVGYKEKEPVPRLTSYSTTNLYRSTAAVPRSRGQTRPTVAFERDKNRSLSQSTTGSIRPVLYDGQLNSSWDSPSQRVQEIRGGALSSAPVQQTQFASQNYNKFPGLDAPHPAPQPYREPYRERPYRHANDSEDSEASEPVVPQYPADFNSYNPPQQSSGERPGVLQKSRRFADAYDERQQGHYSASSGSAKRVMDVFRRIGKKRKKEY